MLYASQPADVRDPHTLHVHMCAYGAHVYVYACMHVVRVHIHSHVGIRSITSALASETTVPTSSHPCCPSLSPAPDTTDEICEGEEGCALLVRGALRREVQSLEKRDHD